MSDGLFLSDPYRGSEASWGPLPPSWQCTCRTLTHCSSWTLSKSIKLHLQKKNTLNYYEMNEMKWNENICIKLSSKCIAYCSYIKNTNIITEIVIKSGIKSVSDVLRWRLIQGLWSKAVLSTTRLESVALDVGMCVPQHSWRQQVIGWNPLSGLEA